MVCCEEYSHDVRWSFPAQELNMILNIICNSPVNATCCVPATMNSTLASYVYMDASFLLLV